MSNQPSPSSPWLRLGSIARPTMSPTPAAAPSPPPAPASAPRLPTPPLLRPTFPVPTLVSPVVAEPPPRPPPPARAPSTTLMAMLSPLPQKPTPLPTATAPPPVPIVETPIPPASGMVTSATAATGPPVPSIAIQKPVTPSAALPADIKPLNETPPRSPRHKPVPSPLLSPLKLPPPQIKAPDQGVPPQIPLEAEEKNMLFHKITTVPEQKPGDRHVIHSSGAQKPGTAAAGKRTIDGAAGMVKKTPGARDMGVKLITITGENRGATMELTRAATNRPQKISDWASSSSSDEGKHGTEDTSHKVKAAEATMTSPPMAVYTNSNVQGFNNSIIYNSSCTHRDPGVHFTLTRKPAQAGFPRIKDHMA